MYKKHVLENGLTIIGEEIPYVKSISLGEIGRAHV